MATKSFREDLLKKLRNRDYALEYLQNALDDMYEDKHGYEDLLTAIRDVIDAQSSMSEIAETADIGRTTLYKQFRNEYDYHPEVSGETVFKVLKALNVDLKVEDALRKTA